MDKNEYYRQMAEAYNLLVVMHAPNERVSSHHVYMLEYHRDQYHVKATGRAIARHCDPGGNIIGTYYQVPDGTIWYQYWTGNDASYHPVERMHHIMEPEDITSTTGCRIVRC